jgi:hypothetical protein
MGPRSYPVRRKRIGCAAAAVLVVFGLVVIRVATRNRADVLAELPGVGGSSVHGIGPIASGERLLVADRSGPRVQLLDPQLKPVASFPTSSDVVQLSASRDLSIVAALEYRRFCVIDTRSGAQRWHPLEKMSTEVLVSPAGTQLWVGEYESGVMHQYEVNGTDVRHARTVDIKAEAARILGAPRLIGPHDFRVVAVAHTTTYLYSDAHEALLIYDWAAGQSMGSIPLPSLNSFPTFVQSPDGKLLAIISNRLLFVDLSTNAVAVDKELDDYSRAGDFNLAGDRFFVTYSAPDMLPIPFTHRGGQIDEFDLQGNRLKTWHSKALRINEFGARGPVAWMVADDGLLQTIRLP